MFDLIFHSSLPPYVEGQVAVGRKVRLLLRIERSFSVDSVRLRTAPEGEEEYVVCLLKPQAGFSGRFSYWQAEVELKVPLLNYRFQIITSRGNYWFSSLGLTRYTPLDAFDFRLLAESSPPEWIYDSIFYQIFPDRFCCGNPELNVKDGECLVNGHPSQARAWHDDLQPGCGGREFFGGDLPGIISRLDYLQNLGVNALYLNPIFTAPSNHKYDVADYYNVDPHLGGNQALVELRQELDKRNMHLVLDIVPNHCGRENLWFKAAQSDSASPECEFFSFTNYPQEYECWLEVKSLPRFNYASLELRRRMYQDSQAVMRYWLRPPYSIDGWRLDVANMLAKRGRQQLGHKIGRQLRRAVKETKPQAWILGEHFFDGTPHLQGDELDASMNYRGFTAPLLQWLCSRDTKAIRQEAGGDYSYISDGDFIEQLELFRKAVPEAVALGQFNLLDSHDMPRILNSAGGDKRKVKSALLMLFAYQGVPCIYYGDEVGMEGGKDPDCRRPMIWEEEHQDGQLLEYCRRLCQLRRQHSSLSHGSLQWLAAPDDTIAFVRESAQEWALVVIRRQRDNETRLSEEAEPSLWMGACDIPENTLFTAALSGQQALLQGGELEVLPQGASAEIWLASKVQ